MKNLHRVEMGRDLGKKDMVFCLIYSKHSTPYENYDYFLNSEDVEMRKKANMEVPMILAQLRWDGKLGFPGGNVEKHHKTLFDAIKDELIEEIDLKIYEDRLKPLTTFADDKKHITSFKYEVSYDELKSIHANSRNSKHYYSENCGSVLLQIHEKSLSNLKNQIFSGTGKDELMFLVDKEGLLGGVE